MFGRWLAVAWCVVALMAPAVVSASTPAEASPPETASAPSRVDGRSVEAFNASLAALEADMGATAKLAFHMKLAQVRNKLAEQRGRSLTDAEFAAALDGKSLTELDAMADAAPAHIQIDIETSDDT